MNEAKEEKKDFTPQPPATRTLKLGIHKIEILLEAMNYLPVSSSERQYPNTKKEKAKKEIVDSLTAALIDLGTE